MQRGKELVIAQAQATHKVLSTLGPIWSTNRTLHALQQECMDGYRSAVDALQTETRHLELDNISLFNELSLRDSSDSEPTVFSERLDKLARLEREIVASSELIGLSHIKGSGAVATGTYFRADRSSLC